MPLKFLAVLSLIYSGATFALEPDCVGKDFLRINNIQGTTIEIPLKNAGKGVLNYTAKNNTTISASLIDISEEDDETVYELVLDYKFGRRVFNPFSCTQ